MEPDQTIQYGGFWRRTFAFLIDLIIIKILNLILVGLGILAAYQALDDLRFSSPSEDLVFLLIGLFVFTGITFFFIYFLYFNWKGYTPGMNLSGLRIISTSSSSLTFSRAFVRTSGLLISFFFFGIGFLIMLFNHKRQTLHDVLAGTYVIKT
ncbi:MAG: RDD family protein [Nitrospiria bacterium]